MIILTQLLFSTARVILFILALWPENTVSRQICNNFCIMGQVFT